MRQFIRHPTDIPIEFELEDTSARVEHLNDVSHGGLSFRSCSPLTPGSVIKIRIQVHNKLFAVDGTVIWCRERTDKEKCWDIGVEFNDGGTEFTVRMVEQLCHIEHYRRAIKEQEGRDLTTHEAAAEWIIKYAGEFPR